MKSILSALLLFTGVASFAQARPLYNFLNGVNPYGKEVYIQKGYQAPHTGPYYTTPVYNDKFLPPAGADAFIVPDSSYYYKEKKVSQVVITGSDKTTKFILDLNTEGQAIKTSWFTDLLRESYFFYDAKGRMSLRVNTFGQNGIVWKIDSISYFPQKKIMHDTVYEYTTVYTRTYKSGAFLNEQNTFFNKTYLMAKMPREGVGWSNTFFVGDNTILRTRLKCNYPAGTFYFSREIMDVDDYHFTYLGKPLNPGEKALETYVPELAWRGIPRYSDLPCEKFQEPCFTRTNWICGSGLQRAREFESMQQSIHYTYSATGNQLHDTCYINGFGNTQSPLYTFSYSYFD